MLSEALENKVYEIVLDPGSDSVRERLQALCDENPTAAAHIEALANKLSTADRLLPQDRSAALNAPPLQDGKHLGEYELVRESGRGGMGVVFEAWQPSLRRSVALKVLPAHLTTSEEAVERFRREGAASARLRHESIIDTFGFGEEQGHYFLAMEFVEGAPLHRILDAARGLKVGDLDGAWFGDQVQTHTHRIAHDLAPADRLRARPWPSSYVQIVVRAAMCVAEALEHAHCNGIVHRDVKPSNILVRSDHRVVLTDFGLARESDLPALTMTGSYAGTPYYSSPEQAAGQRDRIDGRSDVFSLGATLYEMLTLEPPFPGDTSQQILDRIQRREPADPSRLNAHVAPDLAAVVLKALEKEPSHRYATCADFAADLRATLEHRSVAARRASLLTRAGRWVRREPLRATVVGLLAFGLPTVSLLGGAWIANAPKVAAAERQEQRRKVEELLTAAQIRLSRSDYRGAEADFRAARQLDRQDAEVLAGLAYSVLASGRAQEAKELLASSDLAHPAVERVSTWIRARLNGQQISSPSVGEAKAPFELVLMAEEELRLSASTDDRLAQGRALAHLDAALKGSPRARPMIHYRLAQLAGDTANEKAARQIIRAMNSLWPDRIMTVEAAVQALFKTVPEEAIQLANRGVARQRTAALIGARASAYLELANRRRVLDRKPKEAAALYAKAIADAKEVIDLEPGKAYSWGRLAEIYYKMRRFEDSLAAAEQAVQRNPRHQLFLWRRAYCLRHLGRLQESLAGWQALLALYPKFDQAWNNLSDVARELGDKKLALDAAQKAIELRPNYRIGLCTLAEAWLANDDYSKAKAAYLRCVTVAPKDAYAWHGLAQALLHPSMPEVSRDQALALRAAKTACDLAARRGGRLSYDVTLGQAHLAAGDKVRAQSVLGKVRSRLVSLKQPSAMALMKRVDRLLRECK